MTVGVPDGSAKTMRETAPEQQAVILPARQADLAAVFRIAEASFPIPWPLEELHKELSRPFSALRVLRPCKGARVAAFLNHWRVADELQLMNVAVAPDHRRRGYGNALLRDLLHLAGIEAISAITLEVRRSNVAAIRLYERHGFQRVGLRPRYYSDNGEDALVMRRSLAAL
jgi:ribosomal-protein-alanine N-acetyltransferase